MLAYVNRFLAATTLLDTKANAAGSKSLCSFFSHCSTGMTRAVSSTYCSVSTSSRYGVLNHQLP